MYAAGNDNEMGLQNAIDNAKGYNFPCWTDWMTLVYGPKS